MSLIEFVSQNVQVTFLNVITGAVLKSLVLGDISGRETSAEMMPEEP